MFTTIQCMYYTFTGMYMYMHVCYVCTTLHEAIHKAAQVEYLLTYLLHVNSTGAPHALPSTDLRVRKDLLYKPIVGVLHKAGMSLCTMNWVGSRYHSCKILLVPI